MTCHVQASSVSSLRIRRPRPTARCRTIPPARPDLVVILEAQPNPDFALTSHRGSIKVKPRQVACSSIAEAVKASLAFIAEFELGGGNFGGRAGLVLRGGAPLCRVAYNGSLWAVDAAGKETGQRYIQQEGGAAG